MQMPLSRHARTCTEENKKNPQTTHRQMYVINKKMYQEKNMHTFALSR